MGPTETPGIVRAWKGVEGGKEIRGMPYLVSYAASQGDLETCVSDEETALRLAAAFEARGLEGVAIRASGSDWVFSSLAFRLHSGAGATGASSHSALAQP